MTAASLTLSDEMVSPAQAPSAPSFWGALLGFVASTSALTAGMVLLSAF